MKKLLYGTTALIAAGALASGPAVGATKVKMGVGGYMQAFFVGVDQDDNAGDPGDDRRDHLVAREGEIIFNGTTTFDNGLKVGAQVQLEAETCGDQIDEGFIFFSGSWGRINIGSENSAAYLMHYSAPAPSHWAHGLQSSNFMHAGPGTNAAGTGHAVGNFVHTAPASLTSDSEKITYFTPRLSGFQFGVSYTPERCQENNGGRVSGNEAGCGGSYSGAESDNDGVPGEIIELGANYVGTLGGVSVNVSGSYGTNEGEGGGVKDTDESTLGANIGAAGFTVGAGWRHEEDIGGANIDSDDFTIGVRYASGPWGVGVQYTYAEQDRALGGEDDFDGFEVGGSYTLGPGVLLSGGVQYLDWESETNNPANENEAWVGFIGTHVAF